MAQALAEIERRNKLLRGLARPLTVDVFDVEGEQDTDAALRRLGPDLNRYRVIFTNSQTVARIAQLLAPRHPIVFGGVDDPVANCLVDSLARPGRKATGYMHMLQDTEAKMLEVLHDGYPDVREIVVLAAGSNYTTPSCVTTSPPPPEAEPLCLGGWHSNDAYVHRLVDVESIEAHAQRLHLTARYLVICKSDDFSQLHAQVTGARTGILVPWHSLFVDNANALIEALRRVRRPAVGPNRAFAEAGGLIAVEPILDRGADRPAVLALMQVIDGRDPAELPVQGPRGFEVTYNVETGTALGLRPERPLLWRADHIIP